MSLGEKIRALRQQRNMTVEELAEKLEVPASCLHEVERDARTLGSATLKRLAGILDAPQDYFAPYDLEESELDAEPETVEYITSSVGDKIRQLREERGLTLVEFGKKARISFTHISEIERGNTCPSIRTLEKLAGALGIPVTYLLMGDNCTTLGERLKRLRETHGITQSDLASRIGISHSLIAQIEGGKTQPSLNTLEKLARVLGVSPAYFLINQDRPENNRPEPLLKGKLRELFKLLKGAPEAEIEMVIDLLHLLRRWRSAGESLRMDPLVAEVVNWVEGLSPEEKQSVIDYARFIANKRP